MGIGASVFLIAVGLILTFALEVRVGFLDIDVLGWILVVAGVVGLIMTVLVWGPRRRTVVRRGPGTTVEERTKADPTDVL